MSLEAVICIRVSFGPQQIMDTATLPGASAVLIASAPVPSGSVPVQGPDFESSLDLQDLLSSYDKIGFQATSLGKAIHIVNKMVRSHSPYIRTQTDLSSF